MSLVPVRDAERARALGRIKLAATVLIACTGTLFVVARHFEPVHWAWSYLATFAAAATVGGLADCRLVCAVQPLSCRRLSPAQDHQLDERLHPGCAGQSQPSAGLEFGSFVTA